MRGISVLGALLVACGGSSSGTDAAIVPADAVDAAQPTPVLRDWVLDRQRLPSFIGQAAAMGLDLDGDGKGDNQLGRAIATLIGQGFSDYQALADRAVGTGTLMMLAEANVAGSVATFTMFTGTNARPVPCVGSGDGVCRRHLAGTGIFDIATDSARDEPLVGSLVDGTLEAGPGRLRVQVLLMTGVPVELDLRGARVKLQMASATGFAPSLIGGAISMTQIDTRLYSALQHGAETSIAARCTNLIPPDCGCAPVGVDLMSRAYLNLFDTAPKDCMVSFEELKNSALLQSLFVPDVMIDGKPAMSFGFSATAVKATF